MPGLIWKNDVSHGPLYQTTRVDGQMWVVSRIAGMWYWGKPRELHRNPPMKTELDAKEAVDNFLTYGSHVKP